MKITNRLLFIFFILNIIGAKQYLLSQSNNIKISVKRNDDNTVDLSYTKKQPGSYYINLEFTGLSNCNQSDFKKVIKYKSGRLLTLKPINNKQPINFSYRVNYVQGHPNPKVDKDFIYLLPFKIGESIRIIESTSLKETYFNAKKDTNWKSFVVDRKDADTVYCMRKGIVTEIKSNYNTNPADLYKYTSKMNSIKVEHKDGTIARYIGFNKKSIFVQLGQTVYPQTQLGVLDSFNDSKYRLYFDISYLKDIDFKNLRNRTINSENQTQHILPKFYSANGPILLEHNKTYSVEMNDDTLLKEFTRKERKKVKKGKRN